MTPAERGALRGELEEALLQEAMERGADRIRRAEVARAFVLRGLSRSTAYQWVADALDSGRLGQALARRVRESAEARAAVAGVSLAEDAADQAARVLPQPASVATAIAETDSAVDIIREMAATISDVKAVRATAFGEDSKPRNTRLLLRAAEAMRRNLETAVRLQQAMHELGQVERFHQAIVAEIAKESPELAQRVVARLSTIADLHMRP